MILVSLGRNMPHPALAGSVGVRPADRQEGGRYKNNKSLPKSPPLWAVSFKMDTISLIQNLADFYD